MSNTAPTKPKLFADKDLNCVGATLDELVTESLYVSDYLVEVLEELSRAQDCKGLYRTATHTDDALTSARMAVKELARMIRIQEEPAEFDEFDNGAVPGDDPVSEYLDEHGGR